ncbi:MAG TPA: hypothetical protein VFB50_07575 [Chloroflexota bacterium]|nr:hypothetical protein [Chloroflexota bacterium]
MVNQDELLERIQARKRQQSELDEQISRTAWYIADVTDKWPLTRCAAPGVWSDDWSPLAMGAPWPGNCDARFRGKLWPSMSVSTFNDEFSYWLLTRYGTRRQKDEVWAQLCERFSHLDTPKVAGQRALVGQELKAERDMVAQAMAQLEQPRQRELAEVLARLKGATSVDAMRRWLDQHPEVTEGFAIRRNRRRISDSRSAPKPAKISETHSEMRSENPVFNARPAPH